jgi:hypothetical protein
MAKKIRKLGPADLVPIIAQYLIKLGLPKLAKKLSKKTNVEEIVLYLVFNLFRTQILGAKS